jgi:5-methylcytosine-specific restriction endonuclease McrA
MTTRRDDWTWQQLRARFKAHCRMRNALCHICVERGDIEHAQIDYNAPPLSPNAFECDHIRPWETHPQARYLWNNLAASHSRCNRARGARTTTPGKQQVWVKPDW